LAGVRKSIPAATEAAVWALSNGRCYAPGCLFPVVVEIRPGIYRKNAQIAHIRGVRAPRFDPGLSPEACASFANLLLLCLPHHGEVDDRKTGEKLYPPELLRKWKTEHEGRNGPALAALGPIDEDTLTGLLLDVFTPPAKRLQQVADQLEKTGTLNAQTVAELRQIVQVMTASPTRADIATATLLADAAEVYGSRMFSAAAAALGDASDVLPGYLRDLDRKIAQLHDIADMISNSSRRMGEGW
jgi:hypothetical protein